ncbi:SRSO17 transposase [Bradyrhizobium sp. GM22.5]
MPGWEDELERWLMPFLDGLGHKTRQRMCPPYVAGLIGPGDRKSVQPMAERLATGNYDQLHHFIADGVWDATPLETELLNQADRLVGGKDAVLVMMTLTAEEGRTLGWRCSSICVGSRQDGKLPNAGDFDACARQSAGDGRVASLFA